MKRAVRRRRLAAPRLAPTRRAIDAPELFGDGVDAALERDGLDVRGDAPGVVCERLELTASTITTSRLPGAEFAGARWRDVLLTGADLSGAQLEGATLRRCSFVDCRLSGLVLASARLEDVTFLRCRLDQASLRMLVGQRVRWEASELDGADLYQADLAGAQLLGCRLVGAELSQARLAGAELHGSDLQGARGAAALAGVVVGPEDVVGVGLALLGALGIEVTEEPTPIS